MLTGNSERQCKTNTRFKLEYLSTKSCSKLVKGQPWDIYALPLTPPPACGLSKLRMPPGTDRQQAIIPHRNFPGYVM